MIHNSDTALVSARHMVTLADDFFAQGSELIRMAYAALRSGNAHAALAHKKHAYRAYDSARVLYARGHLACGAREARRCRSILAVACVSIYAYDPLPIPGSSAKAQEAHDFSARTLMKNGRAALRRHQITSAVTRNVTEKDMSRAILDDVGVWKDSIGCVVKNERRTAVEAWQGFVSAASNYLSGWRVDEFLAKLPVMLDSQSRHINKAFEVAVA